MLESLDPELEKRLPEIAQFWIERSLETGPSDKEAMEAAVRQVYRAVGLNEPSLIVWAGSPYAGQIVGNLLEAHGKEYWETIKNYSLKELEEALSNEKDLTPQFFLNCDGQFDSHWVAFYDIFYDLGVVTENRDWFEGMKKLTETGWWTPFEDFVVMTERPEFIKLNGLGELHSTTGPSIKYPDGWCFYNVNGTRVPDWIVEDPERITSKKIFEETNLEVRRVMCEIYGWKNLTSAENGFILVDSCVDPANGDNVLELYRPPADLFGEVHINVLICVNATPEKDGRIPKFGLMVPHNIKTALGAVGWSFDEDPNEYAEIQRAT